MRATLLWIGLLGLTACGNRDGGGGGTTLFPDAARARDDAAPAPADAAPAPADAARALGDAAPVEPDAGRPPLDRLRAHVDRLAGALGGRAVGDPAALAGTEAYVTAELETSGYTVTRLPYDARGDTFANLEVTLPGTERPTEITLIGAHYDCVPTTPGADDNATGVAAILELARRFAHRPQPRTVRFVLFVNEEPPYFQTDDMGSLVYARAARAADEDLVAMVSLEMLGYYDDAPGSQELPLGLAGLFPETGNFLAFVSDLDSRALLDVAHGAFAESGFPAEKLAAPPNLRESGFSDQWSFWQVGYPALMVTDTAFLRNPHYHRPTDTPHTLDFDRFAAAVDGLEGMVVRLAE